jgi:sugar lactone lactonase YvrE
MKQMKSNMDLSCAMPFPEGGLAFQTGLTQKLTGTQDEVDPRSSILKRLVFAGLLFCVRIAGRGAYAQDISTFAGNGTAGFSGDNGAATNAEINFPGGVAVDLDGNVYIADTDNNRIREVTTGAEIITVAGNGTAGFGGDNGLATGAELSFPEGVGVDGNGYIYIADSGNNRIRRVSSGIITTVAENGTAGFSGEGGAATSPELNFPVGVGFDTSNNVYIADSGNNRIREVTVSSGVINTVAGSGSSTFGGDTGSALSAGIPNPVGVAFDPSNNMYIVDQNDNRIREVVNGTTTINTVVGSGEASEGVCGPAANGLKNGLPPTQTSLSCPSGIAFDPSGNMYIADSGNEIVRRLSGETVTIIAGNGTAGFSGDGGPGASAELNDPAGVAVAESTNVGTVYIADSFNSRIRKIAP